MPPPSTAAWLERYGSAYLESTWADLNGRYFHWRLPPIRLLWSRRLTASMGLFSSRSGPRSRAAASASFESDHRIIRLSLPLFTQLAARSAHIEAELIGTIAHEMIHQWQYDVLKRRPNHGPDFRRMMECMNRDGLGITVYHQLTTEVEVFARYVWRCERCGYLYRRQRRTIQPRRHQCGACRGPLRLLDSRKAGSRTPAAIPTGPGRFGGVGPVVQLTLNLFRSSPL